MKSQNEIAESIRLSNQVVFPEGGKATITLPSGFCGSVIWGRDEGGWEHVSVSSYKRGKMPTWDDMCRVKDVFFEVEEEAVQVHPRESEYLHSVGPLHALLDNVLHIWRPKDGDWSLMNKEREA